MKTRQTNPKPHRKWSGSTNHRKALAAQEHLAQLPDDASPDIVAEIKHDIAFHNGEGEYTRKRIPGKTLLGVFWLMHTQQVRDRVNDIEDYNKFIDDYPEKVRDQLAMLIEERGVTKSRLGPKGMFGPVTAALAEDLGLKPVTLAGLFYGESAPAVRERFVRALEKKGLAHDLTQRKPRVHKDVREAQQTAQEMAIAERRAVANEKKRIRIKLNKTKEYRRLQVELHRLQRTLQSVQGQIKKLSEADYLDNAIRAIEEKTQLPQKLWPHMKTHHVGVPLHKLKDLDNLLTDELSEHLQGLADEM